MENVMHTQDSVPSNGTSAPSGGLSLRGIWEVFTKPASFFAELKDHPKILIPYLVLAVVVTVGFVPLTDMIWEMQKSSPEFQRQLEMQGGAMDPSAENMIKMTIPIFGVLSMLLLPLLYTLLVMFFGNFVMAGKASFKQILSVFLYAGIIFAVGLILHLPLVLAKDSLTVSFSLAALLPDPDLQDPLYTLLSKISVFHIWEFIVVGIGLSVLYGFSRNKGYVLAVLSLGIVSALHVVSAIVGKMFAS